MVESAALMRGLHAALRPGTAPPVIATATSGHIAAAQVECEDPDAYAARPLPQGDGWLFRVCLTDDGGRCAAGRTAMLDLADGRGLRACCRRALFVVLSRQALDAIAERLRAAPADTLAIESGACVDDETLARLAMLLQPELVGGERSRPLFVDHLLNAFAVHVALAHARLVPGSGALRGGLATWQLRRAQELLRSSLGVPVRLKEVASACRLSVSHFSRAFRRSTGMAPYAWLREQRIEAAKSLLRARTTSLSEVAAACGFSDQSHFTRVFHREVGASPGAWRRVVITPVQ